MGLISKIEEKISGGSSEGNEQSKLQKPPPEGSSSDYTSGTSNTTSGDSGILSGGGRTTGNTSGGSDQTRYPISSSGDRPTGTAVDNYGSTSTSSARTGDQGTIGMPGGYSSSGTTDRTAQPTTTTTTTTSSNRVPGGGGAGTASDVRYEPRSPYDPYSAKGQQTAANATTTRPTESMRPVGGESRPVAGDARPMAGQQYGPTGTSQLTSQSTSSHHYGRDAGIVGGTGAAGVGAYEMGKHSGTTSSGYGEPGMTSSRAPIASQPPTGNVASQPSGASYMDRDTLGGQQHRQMQGGRPFVDESAGMGGAGSMGPNTMGSGAVIGGGEESPEEKAKKMSDAYQAGYRDGMEHMKAEMQKMQMK